jgi:hypothetical protein
VISFLHGLNYIQDGVITLIGLILMTFMLVTGTTPILSQLLGGKLIILVGVLQISDFYRQRFYLDWRNEWGLAWRASVLQFAKWPYILLALSEVMLGRRLPYAITPKVKELSRGTLLLWPHLYSALILSTAWIIGLLSKDIIYPSVHVWMAIIVAASLALILTEFMNFPHPYDKKLLNK